MTIIDLGDSEDQARVSIYDVCGIGTAMLVISFSKLSTHSTQRTNCSRVRYEVSVFEQPMLSAFCSNSTG